MLVDTEFFPHTVSDAFSGFHALSPFLVTLVMGCVLDGINDLRIADGTTQKPFE